VCDNTERRRKESKTPAQAVGWGGGAGGCQLALLYYFICVHILLLCVRLRILLHCSYYYLYSCTAHTTIYVSAYSYYYIRILRWLVSFSRGAPLHASTPHTHSYILICVWKYIYGCIYRWVVGAGEHAVWDCMPALLAHMPAGVLMPSEGSILRPQTPVASGLIHQQRQVSYNSSFRPHTRVLAASRGYDELLAS
jgi:hypothetical protein